MAKKPILDEEVFNHIIASCNGVLELIKKKRKKTSSNLKALGSVFDMNGLSSFNLKLNEIGEYVRSNNWSRATVFMNALIKNLKENVKIKK